VVLENYLEFVNVIIFFIVVLQCFTQVATTLCKSLKISDKDLHSCIFDVAITNDTTFSDQETFKQGKRS